MKNKVIKIISVFLALFIVYQIIVGIIFWRPFVKEANAWQLNYIDNKTNIVNGNFNIEFEIPDHCLIDSDIINQLWADYIWGAKILCDNSNDYIIGLITKNSIDLSVFEKLNDKVYFKEYEDGLWDIVILQEDKKLLIGGNKNTLNIKENILNTIDIF